MYVSQEIAERIKEIAKSKGIQLKDMLYEIGVGTNTMQNMKTSMPKTDTIAKIADYMGVSVDYLLGREEKPTPSKTQSGIRPDEIIAVKGTAAQWLELLNGMTDEQLLELKDYAEYLIAKGGK